MFMLIAIKDSEIMPVHRNSNCMLKEWDAIRLVGLFVFISVDRKCNWTHKWVLKILAVGVFLFGFLKNLPFSFWFLSYCHNYAFMAFAMSLYQFHIGPLSSSIHQLQSSHPNISCHSRIDVWSVPKILHVFCLTLVQPPSWMTARTDVCLFAVMNCACTRAQANFIHAPC
jgi:hypothetical protein